MKKFNAFLVILFATLLLASCGGNSKDGGSDGGYDTSGADNGGVSSYPWGSGPVPTVFYFDYDQATLNEVSRAALQVHAGKLKSSGDRIRLEGHADERGTREYNLALGERRAKAVASYLQASGVSSSQLEVVSYGEEYPADNGSTEYAYSKNRRVEMK